MVAFGDNIIASGSLNNPDGWQCNRSLAQLGLQSGQTIVAIRTYDSSTQAIKRRRIEQEQLDGNEGTASLDSLPSNNGHQNLASRKDWASQADENDDDGSEAYPLGINDTVGNPGAETANYTPPGRARPRALVDTYGTGFTDTISAYPAVENPHHPDAADTSRSVSKLTEDSDQMDYSTMPSSGSRPSSSPAGTVGQALTSAVPRERSPHSNSCSSNEWTGPLNIRNERDDRAAADFLRCMVTFHLAPCFGRFEMVDVSLPHGTSLEDTKKAIEMALSLDADDLWIIFEDRRQNLRDITRFPIHKGQVFSMRYIL